MYISKRFHYGFAISVFCLSASISSGSIFALSNQKTSVSSNVKNLAEAQSIMESWKDEQSKTSKLLEQYRNIISSYEKQRSSLGKFKDKISSMSKLPAETQEKFIKMHEDFLGLKSEGKSLEERPKAILDDLNKKSQSIDETVQTYQMKVKDAEERLDQLNKKIEKGQIAIDRMQNFKARLNRFETSEKENATTANLNKAEPTRSKVGQLIKKFE